MLMVAYFLKIKTPVQALTAATGHVSGTGSFMSIVFSASTSGISTLIYNTNCELVEADNVAIEVKGFGEGVVNAN